MKLLLPTGLTLVALFTVSCSNDTVEVEKPLRLVPVEVLEIRQHDSYPIEERFVGRVEAKRRSDLAFELSGIVEQMQFEEGETVESGEVLATIDRERLLARQNELEATLAQAEATNELTGATLQRFNDLIESNSVSVQDLENAQERDLIAKAALRRIKAQLESIDVDLEHSIVKAPYAGTIARRLVDEGAVVQPNQVVYELLESSDLEVRAALAGDAVRDLKPGSLIPVELPGKQRFELEVKRILPQRDTRTRTVDVILSLDAEGVPDLRDGDLVTAHSHRIVNEPGFVIPRDALTEGSRGLWACLVATPDPTAGPEAYRLDRRLLEVLHEYADAVFVRGALQEKDWVLASGLHKVAPGQRVRIAEVVTDQSQKEMLSRHSTQP